MVTALKSPRVKRPKAYLVEIEAIAAQRDALVCALRDVLKHCVSDTQHMFPEQQRALWRAQAVLIEVGK